MGFDLEGFKSAAMGKLAARALESLPARAVLAAAARKFPEAFVQRIILGPTGTGESGMRAPTNIAAYRLNSWVFACVRAIAMNISQVPLKVYHRTTKAGESVLEPIGDHPASIAINYPNPYLTGLELRYATIAYQETTGDHFWYIIRYKGSRNVAQLVGLRPDHVRIIPGKDGSEEVIDHYQYMLRGKRIELPPEDVLHFKYPNLENPLRGMSTVSAARYEIGEDQYSKQYSESFYKNSAIPKGALVFDMDLDPDEDYDRIRENWNKDHAGVKNAHRIAIFEKGGKYQTIGMSAREMDFIKQRRLTKSDIGGIFGCPPAMLNDYERATYNNVKQQKLFFWYETAIPKGAMMEAVFNRDAARLVPGAKLGEIVFAFDYSNVWALRQEQLDKAKTDLALIQGGAMKINEWRRDNGYDEVTWGDTWWRPIGLTDAENPAPAPGTDAPAKDAGEGGSIVDVVESLVSGSRLCSTNVPELTKALEIRGGDSRRDELRLAEWKGFVINTDHFEKLYAKVLLAFFEDQRRLMEKNLRRLQKKLGIAPQAEDALIIDSAVKRKLVEADIDEIVFDIEEAKDILGDATGPVQRATVKNGGRRAFRMAEVAGTFNVDDPVSAKRIREAEQFLVKKVNETTWNAATASLEEGVRAGESFAKLSDRLTTTIGRRIDDRMRIARTEVVGNMNGGLFDGFEQTGVVEGKDWLDAADEEVREAHAKAGRLKPIPLKDAWLLRNRDGSEARLMYPGDKNGSAEQRIHCRCSMNPHLKSEGA